MNNHNYDSNQFPIRGHPHTVTASSSTAPHPHTNSSRAQPQFYNSLHPRQVPQHLLPELITVHDHDVLSGRGVNIAHHSGNQRFRTLITTYHDESYCTSYSASEKRAVATEIITHIQALDPPGRFLKRLGKSQVSRGLHGPWQQLLDKEACKKTCQALRDCNRADRSGYADGVSRPLDVVAMAQKVSDTGLTTRERATVAAANAATDAALAAQKAASESLKRRRPEGHPHLHINVTTNAQMESHAGMTTHNLATVASSHGLVHAHLHSPSNHIHSPPNHVPQSTSPSMSVGSASCGHNFPHSNMTSQSIIQQNMHNHNHSTAAGHYMNHLAVEQQHQHPHQSYIPYPVPATVISRFSPSLQHRPEIPLSADLTPNSVVGIPHHNQPYTPSCRLRSSGANPDYSSRSIKKQRSTDDTEPSTVSGSSTTSTPMNACNITGMVYAVGSAPYPGLEAGRKPMSCHLSPTVLPVDQEVDIGDTEIAGGLFRIKEDETDADANGSKTSWDGGAGGVGESDVEDSFSLF